MIDVEEVVDELVEFDDRSIGVVNFHESLRARSGHPESKMATT